MNPPASARGSKSHRLGRNLGISLFGATVAGVTLALSLQIIWQAFPERPKTTNLDCRESLLSLIQALHRARRSATDHVGEAAAMRAFRGVLSRSLWARQPAVHTACSQAPRWRRALEQVQRLRYAEEHAVRYESRAVAHDRRVVEQLRRKLSEGGSSIKPGKR